MTWGQILAEVVGNVVPMSAIGLLLTWLGKVHLARIMEHEKQEHREQLQALEFQHRTQLDTLRAELDVRTGRAVRYDESQFARYFALWESLCDLKDAGEVLWAEATAGNLQRFSTQLQDTKKAIDRNALVLEESHRKDLDQLIDRFQDFKIGKEKLLREIYSQNGFGALRDPDVREAIEANSGIRDEYKRLLGQIEVSLRGQVRRDSLIA